MRLGPVVAWDRPAGRGRLRGPHLHRRAPPSPGTRSQASRRLAESRPADAIPPQDAHVTEHRWREEGRRFLALALYRTGRQGDASPQAPDARRPSRSSSRSALEPAAGEQADNGLLMLGPIKDVLADLDRHIDV
jgi:transcriptional activator